MMRRLLKTAVLGSVLLLVSGSAEARKRVWEIGASNVEVSNGETHTYVLSWGVPGWLERLRIDQATLEFYVDAEDNESTEPFHVVVGPAVNGGQGVFNLAGSGVTTFTSAGAGQDRRVLLDVTEAVRYWVRQGGTGYVAIVGEGVAERAAVFSTGNLGGDTVAKLTVWTSNR